ncbi:hypothetical protein N39L_42110 [Limnospira platensis NIES-39]|nr:hypothetical protein N39L_42110 [Arthrospira platensis NIES-39]
MLLKMYNKKCNSCALQTAVIIRVYYQNAVKLVDMLEELCEGKYV